MDRIQAHFKEKQIVDDFLSGKLEYFQAQRKINLIAQLNHLFSLKEVNNNLYQMFLDSGTSQDIYALQININFSAGTIEEIDDIQLESLLNQEELNGYLLEDFYLSGGLLMVNLMDKKHYAKVKDKISQLIEA